MSALAPDDALIGSIGAIAVSALVQDDAAPGADFPQQALQQDGEFVKPGVRGATEVAAEGVLVWCVIQFVHPLRRCADAPCATKAEYLARWLRRRGWTAQRARYVCDLQRDARRYNRSSTPEGVNEMARLNLFEAGHTSRG